MRISVGPPIRTSKSYFGISFTCLHRPFLKVSRRHSGRLPERCEDLRGSAFPIFSFVPSPPPFVTLGLTPALGPSAGVSRTSVKDPPRAFVSLTLSHAFIFPESRGRLTPSPLPRYQCTDFWPPRRPFYPASSGPDSLPPPSFPKGLTSVLMPTAGAV